MLNLIKTQGEYAGIAVIILGLPFINWTRSGGSWAICTFNSEDFIFGSHRSHGEILAKCFSAISLFDEKNLLKTMEDFLDGDIIRAFNVEDYKDINDLAEDFILYGTLAEIFARKTGLTKDLGINACLLSAFWFYAK